ncbi:MAG: hypothetical protein IKK20_01040 [Clostridia bacterium]|nr:hypothetical protein [Clostridia bacterium]
MEVFCVAQKTCALREAPQALSLRLARRNWQEIMTAALAAISPPTFTINNIFAYFNCNAIKKLI